LDLDRCDDGPYVQTVLGQYEDEEDRYSLAACGESLEERDAGCPLCLSFGGLATDELCSTDNFEADMIPKVEPSRTLLNQMGCRGHQ
jgi:hypothetical protein